MQDANAALYYGTVHNNTTPSGDRVGREAGEAEEWDRRPQLHDQKNLKVFNG